MKTKKLNLDELQKVEGGVGEACEILGLAVPVAWGIVKWVAIPVLGWLIISKAESCHNRNKTPANVKVK